MVLVSPFSVTHVVSREEPSFLVLVRLGAPSHGTYSLVVEVREA